MDLQGVVRVQTKEHIKSLIMKSYFFIFSLFFLLHFLSSARTWKPLARGFLCAEVMLFQELCFWAWCHNLWLLSYFGEDLRAQGHHKGQEKSFLFCLIFTKSNLLKEGNAHKSHCPWCPLCLHLPLHILTQCNDRLMVTLNEVLNLIFFTWCSKSSFSKSPFFNFCFMSVIFHSLILFMLD